MSAPETPTPGEPTLQEPASAVSSAVGSAASGTVAPATAFRLTYSVLLRQLVTRGRVLALSAVGIVVALVAAVVGASNDADAQDAVRVIADLGFTVLVPVVALVFSAAALGDAREDRTLVYLWLRPMDRWPVVLGAWAAAITPSLPLTVVPLGVGALLADGGDDLVSGTIVAAIVGVIAYSALFTLASLWVRNPVAWGLGYILVWEGIVAAFGQTAGRLAIRGYTRSIITDFTGIDLDLGDLTATPAIIVPLVVSAIALTLAARRLATMDVD